MRHYIDQSDVKKCWFCFQVYSLAPFLSLCAYFEGRLQGVPGRRRFTWYWSYLSLMMLPGLLLIVSAILALKNMLFKLSWAPDTSFFFSVSAISARKKKQSITWNADISANNRSIWTNLFSLAPQRTGEQDISFWTDGVIVKVGYGRFCKCADLYCTPGR